MKKLIIVESPSKARTIEKFLGSEFVVKSTMGHIIDLPVRKMGIAVTKNFEPEYEVISGKGKIISDLKKMAAGCGEYYIATDEDREGESIGYHIKNVLKLPDDKVKRIAFHEITKQAILSAIKNPRDLDMNLVNAQKARRILDRIVGYSLSPLLIKKIAKGLSAGRVQSVALRFIVEREREIGNYSSRECIRITGIFTKENLSGQEISAELYSIKGEKIQIEDKIKLFDGSYSQKRTSITKEALPALLSGIKNEKYSVSSLEKKDRKSSSPPPFNTASFAAASARSFGYNAKQSMRTAQTLYEGVDIGGEYTGLITYMRTDSYNIAEEAQKAARDFIKSTYGEKYLPHTPRIFKTKSKTAQEAHECIRPVSMDFTPEKMKQYLKADEFNVYSLIYKRFIASQMADAVYATVSFKISGGDYLFAGSGSIVKFKGYLEMYEEERPEGEEEEEKKIPDISEKESLLLSSVNEKITMTPPPPRYNEASLIKTLEKYEIGRPSTYAPIISNLKGRTYIVVEERKFIPQKISFLMIDYLKKYFMKIIDLDFTKNMEEDLDLIASGERKDSEVLRNFYGDFSATLKKADNDGAGSMKVAPKETGRNCPDCSKPLVTRVSRFGEFVGCSGFPRCRFVERPEKKEQKEN